MKFISTDIPDLYVIELEFREDERGHFARTFANEEFAKQKIEFDIVHINRSFTKEKGVLRGMHFQTAPKEEGKIITCLQGAVFDVAIDMRVGSPTYKKWFGVELNDENQKLFYLPKGFAHGFQTLTEHCDMQYLMSEVYSPEHASGVRWNDPVFGIEWPFNHPKMSDKDKEWPLLKK